MVVLAVHNSDLDLFLGELLSCVEASKPGSDNNDSRYICSVHSFRCPSIYEIRRQAGRSRSLPRRRRNRILTRLLLENKVSGYLPVVFGRMATPQLRYSAADRREQILNVATPLFARRGYQGTTTKQIAERAGINEALIFRHFPSKDDLYWAVIERKIEAVALREELREKLQVCAEDVELFTMLGADMLEKRAKDQTLSRLLLFSALENHTLSNRFFRTYVADYYDVLAGFIRERIALGKFRKVDPLLAARGFLGMVIYHSWVQELFGGKRYQNFDVQQVSRTMAEIWLRGMLPSGRNGRNGNAVQKSRDGQKNGHKGS